MPSIPQLRDAGQQLELKNPQESFNFIRLTPNFAFAGSFPHGPEGRDAQAECVVMLQ